jgi:hypothetical protein
MKVVAVFLTGAGLLCGRRELIEIARLNGVSDLETLRDILLARLPVKEAR